MSFFHKFFQRVGKERSGYAAEAASPRAGQRTAIKLLVGFFIFMLLFTLLSRAASGLTIAVVHTAAPSSGILTQELSVSGTVEAVGYQSLLLPEGCGVETVHVEKGSQVKEGDSLISLYPEDGAALLQKKKNELSSLRLELNLSGPDNSGAESARYALERLQQDQENAIKLADEAVDQAQLVFDEAQLSYQRLYKENERYLPSDYKNMLGSPNDIDNSDLELNAGASDEERAWVAAAKEARAQMDNARASVQKAQDEVQAQVRARETTRKNGERSIADARTALDKAEKGLTDSGAQAAQKQKELQLSIQEKETELATLQMLADDGYVLKAPAAGVISEIKATAGSKTTGGEAVSLTSNEAGYRVSVPLTKDQAELLSLGDKANLSLTVNGRKDTITGQLSGLTVDAESTADKETYHATFLLPQGGYLAGESAKVRIAKPSARYDTLVPLAALRTEGETGYVYVIRESEGILGKNYTVEKVSVTILARDSHNAAVEGALYFGETLVTDSSRSLENGDQVRVEQS